MPKKGYNVTEPGSEMSNGVTPSFSPAARNMVDAAGTTKYTYYAGGLLNTEDGPWSSDTVTYTYNNRLRASLSLQQPAGSWTNGFTWDAAHRLSTVSSPAGAFAYSYKVGQT